MIAYIRLQAMALLVAASSLAYGQGGPQAKPAPQFSAAQIEMLVLVASAHSINQATNFGLQDLRDQIRKEGSLPDLPEGLRLEFVELDSQFAQADAALQQRRERLLKLVDAALLASSSSARSALSKELEDFSSILEIVVPMIPESLLESTALERRSKHIEQDADISTRLDRITGMLLSEWIGRNRCVAHQFRTAAALLNTLTVASSNRRFPRQDFFRAAHSVILKFWRPDPLATAGNTIPSAKVVDDAREAVGPVEDLSLAESWFREASESARSYCSDNPYHQLRDRSMACQMRNAASSREKWSDYAWASLGGINSMLFPAPKIDAAQLSLFRNATLASISASRVFIANALKAQSACPS